MPESVSVIIPVVNEAGCIRGLLTYLRDWAPSCEVIVVDGGSDDETLAECRQVPGVRLLEAISPNKAHQMNLGAAHASGDCLLFLHADTLPPEDFEAVILEYLASPEVSGGSFSLTFKAKHWLLTLISQVSRLNLSWFTFGDHGIFVRRKVFDALEGFADLPILEGFEFQRRLRKHGKFVRPDASVLTSARRFVNNGVFFQSMLNGIIMTGYLIGISPERLARLYSNSADVAR